MNERLNKLSSRIIGAAIEVHKVLGPGLLECVYQKCLEKELTQMECQVKSQIEVPVYYKGEKIADNGLRIDLLVNNDVVVELKSVEEVKSVHKKQLLTYLKLMDKPLGLLINFNEELLKNGVTRIAN